MRVPIFGALVVALYAVVVGAAAQSTSREEIVLADPVRAAYYEAAPRAVAASMRRAALHSCASRAGAVSRSGDIYRWLCDGTHLAFLREVDVLGNKLKIGFVCQHEWANLKYYVDEQIALAVEEARCVTVWFNVDANSHFLDFGEAR